MVWRRLTLTRGKLVQEPVTYVAAEWSTFNTAIKVMEEFYSKSNIVSFRSIHLVRSRSERSANV